MIDWQVRAIQLAEIAWELAYFYHEAQHAVIGETAGKTMYDDWQDLANEVETYNLRIADLISGDK